MYAQFCFLGKSAASTGKQWITPANFVSRQIRDIYYFCLQEGRLATEKVAVKFTATITTYNLKKCLLWLVSLFTFTYKAQAVFVPISFECEGVLQHGSLIHSRLTAVPADLRVTWSHREALLQFASRRRLTFGFLSQQAFRFVCTGVQALSLRDQLTPVLFYSREQKQIHTR